jgi:DNA-binding transcriptional LysR family regulator
MNLKKLDLNLLVVFEAIYSAANISHAAKQLGMSQPTVSNALARLRLLMDDPLFAAKRRGVEATVKARQMIGPVREALGIIKGQLNTREIDLASYQRRFRVLLVDAIEPIAMPPLLQLIAETAPGISIECVLSNPNFAEQLRAGTIDLACFAYPFNAPDIVTVPICAIDMVVIARRGHPDIGDRLDLATYTRLGHVALVPELRAMLNVDRDMVAHQVQRWVVYQANKLWSVAPLVERTDLVGLMPRWFAAKMTENFDVAVHELPVRIAEQYVYMIWHAKNEADPGHRWLREAMLGAIRQQGLGLDAGGGRPDTRQLDHAGNIA